MTAKTTTTPLHEHLTALGACDEAMEWIGDRTAQQAWDECERPDWLFWWAGRTQVNTAVDIVRAACACARTALKYVPEGELRPLNAIEAAEAWAREPNDAAASGAARAAAWAAARNDMCVLIRTILKNPMEVPNA